jgi:transcriptional regulator with XRE-family HTH domain
MTFGEQLRLWRIERRMNQRDLANAVDIDFTYLSKIENNRMPPPAEATIVRLAHALDKNPDVLLQLASKIPEDVKPIIAKSPQMPALLRSIRDFSEDEIKQLSDSAQNIKRDRSTSNERES